MKFELCSSCDDAGNMLAGRIDNADFTRVVSSHETKGAADAAKCDLLRWYKSHDVAIGSGCLSIREIANATS